jgi:PhoPQ-activated pathogenicity-related protein
VGIPIDTGGDPKDAQQVYAFLDAANCGSNGTVSTSEVSCPVFLNTGGSYANWAAFATAHADYRIASALPFVISDVQTGGQIIVRDITATKA